MASSATIDTSDDEGASSLLPDMPTESPSSMEPNDYRSALEEFRNNWQKELKSGRTEGATAEALQPTNDDKSPDPEDKQQTQAESLFRKAVELEQRGKVYDALALYRKAVQIDPDIELKFYEQQNVKATPGTPEQLAAISNQLEGIEIADEECEVDLYEKFQMDLAEHGGPLISSNRDAGVITTEFHISDLPTEIIHSILRWVVSSQLDMRSLEQCAAVCKGMYLCARDEKLWRLACEKVWGQNVGKLGCPPIANVITDNEDGQIYNSWREMYINRERVHFSGCYISKTSYLRLGENSFQDQYYRPVQLVEYYRYIRFLPDGTVMMMTSSDEPVHGVNKLKNLQQTRAGVLRGHYWIHGDIVKILLYKNPVRGKAFQLRPRSNARPDDFYTKHCIQFKIASTTKRRFVQLVWMSYSIAQIATITPFEMTQSMYPPLWFSPVRSYHLNADAPLA